MLTLIILSLDCRAFIEPRSIFSLGNIHYVYIHTYIQTKIQKYIHTHIGLTIFRREVISTDYFVRQIVYPTIAPRNTCLFITIYSVNVLVALAKVKKACYNVIK